MDKTSNLIPQILWAFCSDYTGEKAYLKTSDYKLLDNILVICHHPNRNYTSLEMSQFWYYDT